MVFGTRPEAVKLLPLVRALRQAGTHPTVVCTGQHTDLLHGPHVDELLGDHGIHLAIPALRNPELYVSRLEDPLRAALQGLDRVIVQGDTASALAGARAAGGEICHVEAGIRSGNLEDPWPEEGFRRQIDGLAHRHYCATSDNAEAVRQDRPDASPLLTGNTGIDALLALTQPVPWEERSQRVLVTLHRRESLMSGRIRGIVAGLLTACRLHPDIVFLWPVHPNPAVQEASPEPGDRPANLLLLPALAREPFTDLLAHSVGVLTDSGGVQEEAAALGVPAAIARRVTDRPESVASGHALLAGTSANGVTLALTELLLGKCSRFPSSVFGDGQSSRRIAADLLA